MPPHPEPSAAPVLHLVLGGPECPAWSANVSHPTSFPGLPGPPPGKSPAPSDRRKGSDLPYTVTISCPPTPSLQGANHTQYTLSVARAAGRHGPPSPPLFIQANRSLDRRHLRRPLCGHSCRPPHRATPLPPSPAWLDCGVVIARYRVRYNYVEVESATAPWPPSHARPSPTPALNCLSSLALRKRGRRLHAADHVRPTGSVNHRPYTVSPHVQPPRGPSDRHPLSRSLGTSTHPGTAVTNQSRRLLPSHRPAWLGAYTT